MLEDDKELRQAAAAAWRRAEESSQVRIAVIGNRGVGKSTFVNSLRGLSPKEEGAAPVGAIEVKPREERPEGEVYFHCGMELRDVPGAGGSEVAEEMGEDYIRRFCLDGAHAVILMFTSVLSRRQLECAQRLEVGHGVPVFLVRNKVGSDCASEVRDGNVADEDEAFRAIEERTHEEIRKTGDFAGFAAPERVFLVEARRAAATPRRLPLSLLQRPVAALLDLVRGVPRPRRVGENAAPVRPWNRTVASRLYEQEFLRLQKAIVEDVRDAAKQAQLAAILGADAAALAETRAELCRQRVWLFKVGAVCAGAVPVPLVSEAGTAAVLEAAARSFLGDFHLTSEQVGGKGELRKLVASLVARCMWWAAARGSKGIAAAGVVIGAAAANLLVGQVCEELICKLRAIAEVVYRMAMEQEEVDSSAMQALAEAHFPGAEEAK